MAEKGYIHLYTGNGKGKTTAALGLALRGVGAGKKVFIGQFVKGLFYSELAAIKKIPEIQLRQYGLECFIKNKPKPEDVEMAKKGVEEIASVVKNKGADIVILDEICIALYYNLVAIEEVVEILLSKPLEVEIVMTGRYAPQELYEYADLITEMKEIKHYYNKGIEARVGIDC